MVTPPAASERFFKTLHAPVSSSCAPESRLLTKSSGERCTG